MAKNIDWDVKNQTKKKLKGTRATALKLGKVIWGLPQLLLKEFIKNDIT